ncbi:MAG: ABC transporter permease [bacterium]|nr:ABC transporter permease [bacterium]
MRNYSIIIFAWKNLWSHRMRAFLTIGAVTIGIASIVFLVSIAFGLQQLVTNQVANFDAYTTMDIPSANLKTGKINAEAIARIREVNHVVSVDQIVDLAGRIRMSNQKSTTETIVEAVEPNYFRVADLLINEGHSFEKTSKNQVVVNKALVKFLGLTPKLESLSQKPLVLDLIIPRDLRAYDAIDGPTVKTIERLTVVGLINDNLNPMIYIPLSLADSYGVVNRTSLKLKIDYRESEETVRKSIENIGFSTEYVGDTVKQIEQVFALFRLVLGGFGLVALVVAALGAFNTLTISLMERIREVGLLKTLGMKKKEIFKLFIVESLTIGFMGGIFGVLLSMVIGHGLNIFLRYLAIRAHADVVVIYAYTPLFVLFVILGAIVIGFFTGFYPAYRAIKTKPLDALRYE